MKGRDCRPQTARTETVHSVLSDGRIPSFGEVQTGHCRKGVYGPVSPYPARHLGPSGLGQTHKTRRPFGTDDALNRFVDGGPEVETLSGRSAGGGLPLQSDPGVVRTLLDASLRVRTSVNERDVGSRSRVGHVETSYLQ